MAWSSQCSALAGSDPDGPAQTSNSVSTLLSTLLPALLFAAAWYAYFLISRRKVPYWYQRQFKPDTFARPQPSRSLAGCLRHWWQVLRAPSPLIALHCSLDTYLFLRFLRQAALSCLFGISILPLLLALNITGDGNKVQLDVTTIANVGDKWNRTYAHAMCAIIYFGFVIYLIFRESVFVAMLQQYHQCLKSHTLSARTVLMTALPPEWLNRDTLSAMLGCKISSVTVLHYHPDETSTTSRYLVARHRLEVAVTELIQRNLRAVSRRPRKPPQIEAARTEREVAGQQSIDGPEKSVDSESQTADAQLSGPKIEVAPQHSEGTPTAREALSKILVESGEPPAQSKKIMDDLHKRIHEVLQRKDTLDEVRAHKSSLRAALVGFPTSFEAKAGSETSVMPPLEKRIYGVCEQDLILSNVNVSSTRRSIRRAISLLMAVALITLWSIPAAFIGATSNVNYLTCLIPQLDFIDAIPPKIVGLVTGIVPMLILAACLAFVPKAFRFMARYGGDMTQADIEVTVHGSYFVFQVVQVFLVATIGSATASVVQSVYAQPASATSLLAKYLPMATNFYLSYIILQGLNAVAGILAGGLDLLTCYLAGKVIDKTPRRLYERWRTLPAIGWGTLFPIYENLWIISICYAILAPLILPMAFLSFCLFAFAYEQNLLFMTRQGPDTHGRIYARAYKHLFVGLYIAELCLIGYFALRVSAGIDNPGPTVLAVLLLLTTCVCQRVLQLMLDGMKCALPMRSFDLEDLKERSGGSAFRRSIYRELIDIVQQISDSPKEESTISPEPDISLDEQADDLTGVWMLKSNITSTIAEYIREGEVEARSDDMQERHVAEPVLTPFDTNYTMNRKGKISDSSFAAKGKNV